MATCGEAPHGGGDIHRSCSSTERQCAYSGRRRSRQPLLPGNSGCHGLTAPHDGHDDAMSTMRPLVSCHRGHRAIVVVVPEPSARYSHRGSARACQTIHTVTGSRPTHDGHDDAMNTMNTMKTLRFCHRAHKCHRGHSRSRRPVTAITATTTASDDLRKSRVQSPPSRAQAV